MKVGLIACSNGLGHVKRMLSLSQSLIDRGASPTIIAPKESLNRLSETHQYVIPDSVYYSSDSSYLDWMDAEKVAWSESSPSLDSYDIVVSDNIIEVLEFRNDALLSGSFFWHEAITSIPINKKMKAKQLLKQHNPIMIASKLFAADYLGRSTRLSHVGLYGFPNFHLNLEEDRSNILISCGRGGELEDSIKRFVEKIATRSRPTTGLIYIEPTIYHPSMPLWIRPANFSRHMFSTVGAALIRPGIGTVTDCVLYRVKMFMYCGSTNQEIQLNAQKLSEKKLGYNFHTIDSAWEASIDFVKNNLWLKYTKTKQSIDTDGSNQAAEIILGR